MKTRLSKPNFPVYLLAFSMALMICVVGPLALGESVAQSAKSVSFGDDTIKTLLAGKKSIYNYNRVSGMMSSMLRAQRELFKKRNGDKVNEISKNAEDMMNSASMHASTNNFDNSYKELETAYKIIAASLKELEYGK
ncbi:hypothetical protein MNBD_NITROSPINAE02-1116 [hydrothermal vent metagenome]|uniref:Uncharacterized protein n=1 Tax=hydrothermal vent metagenome TaxID=652676 RepID=A0A3B1CS60_9ZZZZ